MGGTIVRCDRPEDQISRALVWLPQGYVNSFMQATDYAEEKLGMPPTCLQIYEIMRTMKGQALTDNVYQLSACLLSLQREDLVLTDKNCYRFTTRRKEGYFTYSDMFRTKYPQGYKVDKLGRVAPTTARLLSFKQLTAILKSSDESLLTANEWMFDGDFRFLDGTPYGANKVCFTSFPRSGNSFLRRTLESVSGVTTGSTVSMHTSTSLQMQGLKGEGYIDDSVWIIKAHHPMLLMNCTQIASDKVIFCVRNPLDVLPSYASLVNTMNHGTKPEYEYERDYAEWWDWYVRKNVRYMRDFFDILIRQTATEGKNPIYIVRYEDLVSDAETTLKGLFSFLLDVPSVDGTNCERRIRAVNAAGTKATQTYALKANTGKFNTHKHRYTDAQVAYIKETLGDWLYYFGYANTEDNETTAFFEFEDHAESALAATYKFREVNEQMISKVSAPSRPAAKLAVNSEGCFDLFDEEDLAMVQYPGIDFGRRQMMQAVAMRDSQAK